MTDLYADIIIDVTAPSLDRSFQYRVPEELAHAIAPGQMVRIPFGKGNSERKGYVVGLSEVPKLAPGSIKDILGPVTDCDTALPALVKLAAWMASSYGSTFAAALRVVFPVKQKVMPKQKYYLALCGSSSLIDERLDFYRKKHQTARARLLEALISQKEMPEEVALTRLGATSSVVKALCEQGVCSRDTVRIYRQGSVLAENVTSHVLNEMQQRIVDGVMGDFDRGIKTTALVKGITGSGKTEVYIQIAREMIKRGRQVIVLIPEIALTYQTVMRFYNAFGERVSNIHSRLSAGERYDRFELAMRGELDVMVGPRSALFTPFPDLGAIIIDEEHEGSYKSEKSPKYHAVEVAIKRAQDAGAVVVLGSATPSVDSYYNAVKGIYKLYELNRRATGGSLPAVEIVDMRSELRKGNRSPISLRLQEGISDRLLKGEQVMLFLNRRGFAGFVSCRSCGYVYRCPHCDVSLFMHGKGMGARLTCHYCGHTLIFDKKCPRCSSPYVGTMKAGTEAMENAVKTIFPKARVLRMDMDTTRGKDAHEKLLGEFLQGGADILVGTQMIVKGHDFPGVTLVGILAADLSLFAPDYRAGENTFTLLTQAAGRAGRGDAPGEVVIQTYNPENPYILAGAAQDYEAFYKYEISYRTLMDYPPARQMLVILFESVDKELVAKTAARAAELLSGEKEYISGTGQGGAAEGGTIDSRSADGRSAADMKLPALRVIGPAPPPVAYINDVHRQVIHIKARERSDLVKAKDMVEEMDMSENVSVQYDFS